MIRSDYHMRGFYHTIVGVSHDGPATPSRAESLFHWNPSPPIFCASSRHSQENSRPPPRISSVVKLACGSRVCKICSRATAASLSSAKPSRALELLARHHGTSPPPAALARRLGAVRVAGILFTALRRKRCDHRRIAGISAYRRFCPRSRNDHTCTCSSPAGGAPPPTTHSK